MNFEKTSTLIPIKKYQQENKNLPRVRVDTGISLKRLININKTIIFNWWVKKKIEENF